MLKNTTQTYGAVAKFLHWIMALLLIGMFALAYTMINLPDSAFKFSLYDIHKATGLLLWGILIIRLLWLFLSRWPIVPGPAWQKSAAKWNKISLYLLMFAMPFTGFFMSTLGGHAVKFYSFFTIQPFANNKHLSGLFATAHEYLGFFLIAAFVLHLLAAMYHYFILKDNVVKRMWI